MYSLEAILRDCTMILLAKPMMEAHQGTPFLTRLDAAACLAPSDWPRPVQDTVALLNHIVRGLQYSQESFWAQNASLNFRSRILNLNALNFGHRLMFYKAQSHGDTMSKLTEECAQLFESLRIPAQFDYIEEWSELTDIVIENMEQLRADFEAVVELEWVGRPLPIESVTTPVEGPEGTQCVVCQDHVTPPGDVANPCKHACCRTCLETWIHACRPASHLCPYCRTELFLKPTYRPKDVEVTRNYLQEEAELKECLDCFHMLFFPGSGFVKRPPYKFNSKKESADRATGVGNV